MRCFRLLTPSLVFFLLVVCPPLFAAPAPTDVDDAKTAAPSPSPAAPTEKGGDSLHTDLAERATDLLATLGRVTLFEEFDVRYPATSNTSNLFQFRGLLPIVDRKTPETGQLIRLLVPITRPLGDHDALGDTQLFDLKTFRTDWGLIGVGPVAFLPTAGTKAAGSGKWSIGPALGMTITKIPHLQLGFLAQNPISFAGDAKRKDVNQLLLQPLITYHLTKGWYLNSDAQMTFNWIDGSREIPVNIGVGRVFKMGDQPVNLNFQYQWTAYSRNMTSAYNVVKLKFEFLFP